MYGREELKMYTLENVEAFDHIISDFESWESEDVFKRDDADKVMDAMEARIKELEDAEYKWFDLVRDFVTVLGNDPYMVWTAIDSRLKIMCDDDEIERWNKLNQSILDRIKVLTPNEWNRTCRNKEESK